MRQFSVSTALANAANIATLRQHNILYLDRGLIAVNKAPGIISQGTHDPQKKVSQAL